MATKNPRITITLTPELHAVLRRLSELTENSQSGIVGELLLSSLPIFERMCSVLEAAQKLKEQGLNAPQAVRDSLDRAQAKLEGQMNLVLDAFNEGGRPLLEHAEKVGRRKGGAGGARSAGGPDSAVRRSPTPVPVTRGSGTPKSRKGIANATQPRTAQQPPKATGKRVSNGKV
jgi:hypothetical protein